MVLIPINYKQISVIILVQLGVNLKIYLNDNLNLYDLRYPLESLLIEFVKNIRYKIS